MVIQNNFFDLWDVFVNELIGDASLAIFLGVILIVIIASRTKTPYQVVIVYITLWFGAVYSVLLSNFNIVWVFLLLFIGLLFYFRMLKITN